MASVRAGVRIITRTQELRRTVADLQVANAELETPADATGTCPTCGKRRDASAA